MHVSEHLGYPVKLSVSKNAEEYLLRITVISTVLEGGGE